MIDYARLSRVPAMLRMGRDLIRGVYPSFVYGRTPQPGELPPIFTFHRTTRAGLEPVLAGLAEGDIRTLTSDEYLAAVRGDGDADPSRSVMLTFDDGDASVQEVLDPLLERYGQRAVVFLIPGRIQEEAPPDDASTVGLPLCAWPEIERMHANGRIDFQSHTLLHHRVFTGNRLRGFVHPELLVRLHPHDLLLWEGPRAADKPLPMRPSYPTPPLGAPLYDSRPRMLAERAVPEDPGVRRACVDLVERQGGERFFERADWRSRLEEVARGAGYATRDGGSDTTCRPESPAERNEELRADLSRARRIIEERLPGKRVRHVAWPWGVARQAAVEAAREAGYEAAYWGRADGGFTNRSNGAPLRLARIGEDFLQCLPGPDRVPVSQVLIQKLLRRSPSTAHVS